MQENQAHNAKKNKVSEFENTEWSKKVIPLY